MESKKFFIFSFVLVFAAACLPGCSKSESAGGHDRASATGAEARSKPFLASARREVYHLKTCKWAAKINDDNLLGYDTAADAESDGFRPCKVCKPDQAKPEPPAESSENKRYPHAKAERAELMADLPTGIDEAWVESLVVRLGKEYNENPGRFWCGVDALLDMRKYQNKEALERQMRKMIEMSPRRHGM